MTPMMQPIVTGEEMCAALGPVARSIEAIIPKGRGVWAIHLTSEEVATGLEISGIRIRGQNIEVSQRFPGGTWIRVRGFPLDTYNTQVDAIFKNVGEIVSGPHHVMWRGTSIKTGDRTIKIKLERNIPQSFSTMQGKVKVTVRYKDQPQTCFECGLPGHEKRDCPKTQSYASKVLVAQPQPEPENPRDNPSRTSTQLRVRRFPRRKRRTPQRGGKKGEREKKRRIGRRRRRRRKAMSRS